MLESFTRTYAGKFSHTTMVRHAGTVVAFALAERRIFYTLLDLDDPRAASGQDADGWLENPAELRFPSEIAQVGYGAADQLLLPPVRRDGRPVLPGQGRPDDEELDLFRSTTARLTADAPFQVLSDGRFLYLFRQAIAASHPDMVYAVDRYGEELRDAGGARVPVVDATLLADRFVLADGALQPKQEVRYRRSRSKYRPQSRKDSLGARDMEERPFAEPTQELDFVRGLSGGRFAVLLLPTQQAGVQRWQFFAHNERSGMVDSFNVERAADGLFNTRGTQFYTCPDHPEVFQAQPGACPRTVGGEEGGDPCPQLLVPLNGAARGGGASLAPLATRHAEAALLLGGALAVELAQAPLVGAGGMTLELWLRPASVAGVQTLVASASGPELRLNEGVVELVAAGGGERLVAAGRRLAPEAWCHVAVAAGPGGYAVTLDGAERSEQPGAWPGMQVRAIGATAGGFDGVVDEVRLWDRPRSREELLAAMGVRLVGREIGLVAYWRLDEAEGERVYDQGDGGYDGTLAGAQPEGGAWVISDAPVGDTAGVSRGSFRLAGRTVTGGLAALLYHQQEDIAAPGGPTEYVKRGARVMLAAATQGAGAEDHALAVLDFGLSREGKLAQAPDVLTLGDIGVDPTKRAAEINDWLTRWETIRALDAEVLRLAGLAGVMTRDVVAPSGTAGAAAGLAERLDGLLATLQSADAPLTQNEEAEIRTLARAIAGQLVEGGSAAAGARALTEGAAAEIRAALDRRIAALGGLPQAHQARLRALRAEEASPFNHICKLVAKLPAQKVLAAGEGMPEHRSDFQLALEATPRGDGDWTWLRANDEAPWGAGPGDDPMLLWEFEALDRAGAPGAGWQRIHSRRFLKDMLDRKGAYTMVLGVEKPDRPTIVVKRLWEGVEDQRWTVVRDGAHYRLQSHLGGRARHLSVGLGEKLTDLGVAAPDLNREQDEIGELGEDLALNAMQLVLKGKPRGGLAVEAGMTLLVEGPGGLVPVTVGAPYREPEGKPARHVILIEAAQGAVTTLGADGKPVPRKVYRPWPADRTRWSLVYTPGSWGHHGAQRIEAARQAYEVETEQLRAALLQLLDYCSSLVKLLRAAPAYRAAVDGLGARPTEVDNTNLTMPLLRVDPSGLTVAGAALNFAQCEGAPLLFDSATGSVALYFRGRGSGQLFAAYYSTVTERARFTLPSDQQVGVLAAEAGGEAGGEVRLVSELPLREPLAAPLPDGTLLTVAAGVVAGGRPARRVERVRVRGSVPVGAARIPIAPAAFTGALPAGSAIALDDLTLVARAAELTVAAGAAETLTVRVDADPASAEHCTLTIRGALAGRERSEIWRGLPRDTRRIAAVLNGQAGEPIAVGRLAGVVRDAASGEVTALDLEGRLEDALLDRWAAGPQQRRVLVGAIPATLDEAPPVAIISVPISSARVPAGAGAPVRWLDGDDTADPLWTIAPLGGSPAVMAATGSASRMLLRKLDDLGLDLARRLQRVSAMVEGLVREAGLDVPAPAELPEEPDPVEALALLVPNDNAWRLLREGATLRIGEAAGAVEVVVAGPPKLLATRVALETPIALEGSGEGAAVCIPDYDYASLVSFDGLLGDPASGSLLVSAASAGAGGGLAVGVEVSFPAEGPACRWEAFGSGSALAFDGRAGTVAAPASADPRAFRPDGDLTLEAWVRPGHVSELATIVEGGASGGPGYRLALADRSSARRFDGRTQQIGLGEGVRLSKDSFTLEAWIFPTGADDGTPYGVLGGATSGATLGPSLWVVGRKLRFGFTRRVIVGYVLGVTPMVETRTEKATTRDDVLAYAEWQHVAVSFGDGRCTIYVNGVPREHSGLDGAGPELPLVRSIAVAQEEIPAEGDRPAATAVARFVGGLDEVRLWNRARTAAEIAADMARRLGGDELDLAGYWQLGQDRPVNAVGGAAAELVGAPVKIPPPIQAYAVVASVNGRALRSRSAIGAGAWAHLAAVYQQGYALRFAGGRVDCGGDVALSITQDLTLEVSLQVPGHGSARGILSKGSPGRGEGQRVPYALWLDAAGRLAFAFEDTGGTWRRWVSAAAVPTGRSVRVAVVREFVQTEARQQLEIRFFVDGRPAGAHQHDGAGADGGDQPLTLGLASPELGASAPFAGYISEVRVWNQALPATRVGAAVGEPAEGLVSWWRLRENGGNVAYDSRGGAHGRLRGEVAWATNPDPAGSPLAILIDGVPVAVEPVDPAPAAAATLSVGASGAGSRFQGQVEELRVWRVARDREQIQDNLFRGLEGESQDLIAYYSFDGASVAATAGGLLIRDQSGNGLHLEAAGVQQQLSRAPVGRDTPRVRSAIAAIETEHHRRPVAGAPGVAEYGDLQYDAAGDLTGILKRAYSVLDADGRWELIAGFRVGRLLAQWVGQIQFDPQLMGYIEGAPPVPSENLTGTGYVLGEFADYTGASSVELTMGEKVAYSYAGAQRLETKAELSAKAGLGIDTEKFLEQSGVVVSVADKVAASKLSVKLATRFETSMGQLDEDTVGVERAVARVASMSLRGYVENEDAIARPNRDTAYDFGRRFVPENFGYALVQSETADIFALRLEHSGLLVTYQVRPNPDIPPDWNIITFPINPHYVKQGTLDGKIGFVPDPDYPGATAYSADSSYFKPQEAYALKRRVQREEEELRAAYEQFRPRAPKHKDLAGSPLGELPRPVKRNLVNTYVWTADGGLFAETEESTDTLQELTAGSFAFTLMAGVEASKELTLAGFQASFELTFMAGASVGVEMRKSRQEERSFGLKVALDKVEGDLYWRNEAGAMLMDTSDRRNPRPKKLPGKVDAYRFMSFYLEPRSQHYDEFFYRVVDPIWLDQSGDPAAAALREARDKGREKRPPCWRVMHRVTFVSRVLQPYDADTVEAATLKDDMQALDIDSNYELIKQLEPFVRPHASNPVDFADAVRDAIRRHLPELERHSAEIIRFLRDYYGLYGDAEPLDGQRGLLPALGAPRAPAQNLAPVVEAGPDLDALVGEACALSGSVADDRTPLSRIGVGWYAASPAAGGSLSFANRSALATTARPSGPGIYRLELRADDGEHTASDSLTIFVHGQPEVAAGEPIHLPPWGQATLSGRLVSDGLASPERGTLRTWWEKLDGPGRVTFDRPGDPQTTASFGAPGAYRLRLCAEQRLHSRPAPTFTVSAELTVVMAGRVAAGLQALYAFEEGAGEVVRDLSGAGEPLDLAPATIRRAAWVPGGLALAEDAPVGPPVITAAGVRGPFAHELAVAEPPAEAPAVEELPLPGVIATRGPAARLIAAIRASNELTVEAWIRPAAAGQPGLARILTISGGPAARNLTVGQRGGAFHVALRTSTTDANAASKALAGGVADPARLTHLVCTRSAGGALRLYLDGVEVASRTVAGDLSSWDPGFALALGGELADRPDGNDRAWGGDYRLVALYSRALAPDEVVQNFRFRADEDLAPLADASRHPRRVLMPEGGPGRLDLRPSLLDDRLAAADLRAAWSCADPAVSFEPAEGAEVTARFAAPGRYRLLLKVEDATQSIQETLDIHAYRAPAVAIEAPPFVLLPGAATLTARVLDNSLGAEGPVALRWERAGEPDAPAPAFADPGAPVTLATFERPGYHRLRLVADTELSRADGVAGVAELTLEVYAAPEATLSARSVFTLGGELAALPLLGRIVDSGQGDIPGTLAVAWSQASGPGAASFEPPAEALAAPAPGAEARTAVAFARQGVYTLAMTVTSLTPAGAAVASVARELPICANRPPEVDAGEPQIVVLPATTWLDGTASDDGFPEQPGALTLSWAWERLRGPELGAVTLGDPAADLTAAAFSDKGVYRLALRAHDGDAGAESAVAITVHKAPVIDAGPNLNGRPGESVALQGAILDYGLGDRDEGEVTVRWRQLSGPAALEIVPADGLLATAVLPVAGSYELALEVSNGFASSVDTLTVVAELRVSRGLLSLYTFAEGEGTTVRDVAQAGEALDLRIAGKSDTYRWAQGGLQLLKPARIASAGPATRIIEAVRRTQELTIEAWVTPASPRLPQPGVPGRIVTISQNAELRNVTLQQGLLEVKASAFYHVRLRTAQTDLNGERRLRDGSVPLGTPRDSLRAALQHVVYTRGGDGAARIYLDGALAAELPQPGDLSGWAGSYRLLLGDDLKGGRAWLGTYHLVAIFERALTEEEVQMNFAAGPPEPRA